MAITQNNFTGDGSTVLFSFTFPYLDESHIKVSLNGSDTILYTLANATTIQMNTAPANGVAIRIYRNTDSSSLEAQFFSGSSIRAQDLNDNFTQILFKTQETENFAASTDSSAIAGTAAGAVSTANTALSVANTANTTANGIAATANTALSNSTAAVTTANAANALAAAAVPPGVGAIVNADINASAGIVDTKLATIATAGKVSNSATTATDANTASAIVARSAAGNFNITSINNGPLAGMRNAAINGNFDIWQRGTTTTGTVGVNERFYVADRWASGISLPSSNSPSGTFTVSQRNCTSTEFSYFNASFYQRLSTNNINVGTVILNNLVSDASSILAIQGIENAFSVLGKTVTLSFWARASTATKIVSEQQIHSSTAQLWTPTICKTFDLTTTWQKFTHTYTLPTYSQVIAAGYNPSTVDATLTNPTYTPIGEAATLPLVDWLFQIDIKTAWSLGTWRSHGNAYSGSRPSGFEGTQQTLAEMQSMNNSFIANGYYDIAQIQLELGPVATPFERRPIGTELALCQRYYEVLTAYVIANAGAAGQAIGYGISFVVPKRAAPSLNEANVTESSNVGALNIELIDTRAFRYRCTTNSSGTVVRSANVNATAEL